MKFMSKLMGAVLGGSMTMGALALPTTVHAMDPMVTPKVIFRSAIMIRVSGIWR